MTFTRANIFAAASLLAIAAAAPAVAAPASVASGAAPAVKYSSATISGLGVRNIGSAVMSGRISAIAARTEADGRTLLLIGAASGGVWKSKDGGTTFTPMFDKQPVQSIGSIALDPIAASTAPPTAAGPGPRC